MTGHSRVVVLGTVLTAASWLAGCGTGDTPAAAPSASSPVHETHDQNDISFGQNMIPLLVQTERMAQLAATRADSPETKDYADRMSREQQPRIDRISALLQSWHIPVPETSEANAQFGTTPGAVSAQQIDQLADSSGPAFDELFTQLMLRHHQGTITLANDERSDGQSGQLKIVAEDIVNSTQAEITELERERAHQGPR